MTSRKPKAVPRVRIAVCYRSETKLPPYANAILLARMEVVPALPRMLANLDGIDGLLLTGGTDIDPAHYEQALDQQTQTTDKERDESELRLLREALDRDLPVLAICRGLQLLNVALGGTLIQHLPDHGGPVDHNPKPATLLHHIEVSEESLLHRVIGVRSYNVNSRHHQAVDRLGEGLVVTARAADGVVEACEMPGKTFVLGVQWHPEDVVATSAPDRSLFHALRNAAR